MRSKKGNTKYSQRERNFEFMGWVKQQPCVVTVIGPLQYSIENSYGIKQRVETPCFGLVEADHQGARGLSHKADDTTCVPMCRDHHNERTDHRGSFRPLTRDEARLWRAAAIEHTQHAWSNR